jgi:hypothetical protein
MMLLIHPGHPGIGVMTMDAGGLIAGGVGPITKIMDMFR